MNLRITLLVALFTLCISNTSYAVLNFLILNEYAKTQDYGSIRNVVYDAESLPKHEQMQLVEWLREKANEGHAPMMYFFVRHAYKTNFDTHNPDAIEEALVYSYASLVRIMQDESCRIAGPRRQVHDLFQNRYDKKFFASVPIDSHMRKRALGRMQELFKTWGAFSGLPAPYWVAFVESAGYFDFWHLFNYKQVDAPAVRYLFELYDHPINNPRVLAYQAYCAGSFKFKD